MIRVKTGARLHFGLLSLPTGGADRWPDRHGEQTVPARQFGGVGLMVEAPGLQVALAPAAAWSATGPLADRALEFARHFVASLPAGALGPQQVVVEQAPPEHSGLGTGTQLGLAVARALAAAAGVEQPDVADLARRIGRAQRSALGTHGFAVGGFLVEGGKRSADSVSPLAARLPFPESWRVVLIFPSSPPGLHGAAERRVFQDLGGPEVQLSATDALCRLVLLGMLPALAEQDLEGFGEALHDFNARAGQMFAPIQGGTYAGAAVAEVVAFVRRQGVRGVGQSSWGPAVFAVVGDEDCAADLAGRLRKHMADAAVVVTRGRNRGAEVVDASG